MSNPSPWIGKSLLISVAVALVTWFGLYLFFKIHQELNLAPAYAMRFSAGAFLLSMIATTIYFRMRTDH